VTTGVLFEEPFSFSGVKLYPRLGYHPQCAALRGLYPWCAEHGIPITTHCSYYGFPDWDIRCASYGAPQNFNAVIEGNPGLRINLAHFGDRSEGTAWGDSIARLIRENRGVYSDLSCFTHRTTLEQFISRYDSVDEVREKTMFGSDFDVMYFTNPGVINLADYDAMFLNVFGADRMRKMAHQVPKRFLGLP
jgi:predicted TIM-barrel fold metal-dependent hydrolase